MHVCPALTLALRLLQAVDTDSDEIITVDDLIVALLLKPDPYGDTGAGSDTGSGDISMTTAYKFAKQEAEQIMRELLTDEFKDKFIKFALEHVKVWRAEHRN